MTTLLLPRPALGAVALSLGLGAVAIAAMVQSCTSRRPIEEIKADMYAANSVDRQFLIVELRGHGTAALPAWIELFDNEAKDWGLHIMVADELLALGPAAAPAIPTVARILREGFLGREMILHPQLPDEFEDIFAHRDDGRWKAREVLSAIGAASVESVREVLTDSRSRARQDAAVTLGQIGGDAAPALGDLAAMVADEDKTATAAAMWALGEIGAFAEIEAPVLQALATALGDESWVVRLEAVKALAKCKGKAAPVRAELEKLVDDPVVEVANHAVHALGEIKLPE